EVRRFEDAEVEPIVLDFVAPEVLRAGWRSQQQCAERGHGHALQHGTLLLEFASVKPGSAGEGEDYHIADCGLPMAKFRPHLSDFQRRHGSLASAELAIAVSNAGGLGATATGRD